MKKIDKTFFIRFFLIAVGVAAFIAAACRLSSIEKEQMVSTTGYSYEKARVVELTADNLTEEGYRVGYQQLKVEILTGDQKGKFMMRRVQKAISMVRPARRVIPKS